MLVLFTDFGWEGPYIGLLKLALERYAPSLPVIDLMHDAPPFDPQGAAFLLATYAAEFPENAVFVGVVDPGVGSSREGLILLADKRCFVGPDNGLFDRIVARARQVQAWRITWVPPRLSASFHGRDLFAPVAAMLAAGAARPEDLGQPIPYEPCDWPDDLARIVYVDRYGNSMTGVRASSVAADARVRVQEQTLYRLRTFSDAPAGQGFWYENSSGLVEIATNQGSAAEKLHLRPGDPIEIAGKTFSRIRAY